MKKKAAKAILLIIAAAVLITGLVICAAFIRLGSRTDALHDGYTQIQNDERYKVPVSVKGIDIVEQQVSCGYAVIEMFSQYSGSKVTEQQLYDEYGKVVTSTGANFCKEMNKRFPAYDTQMLSYLTDSELLGRVYDSLASGVPVPFEWAAKKDGEWTLHYSLVTGMDIPADKVTVANPYGYYEDIPLEEFLDRTSFEAYDNIPLFLKMGFAFGIFEKNTVFLPTKI